MTKDVVKKIWLKDPTLWTSDASTKKAILDRLGWLHVGEWARPQLSKLKQFAEEIRGAGFTNVMVLGMGGSSLCPDVLRRVFPKQPGSLDLLVLDSTDPESVRAAEESVEMARTLFLVSSKSGTTPEVLAFFHYFEAKTKPNQFVAITDSGTPLETLAKAKKFRRIFLNPADIGGRFSALSYFGLIPAALLGIDLNQFLNRAEEMISQCKTVDFNPGLELGEWLAQNAKAGRDKLTLIGGPRFESLGDWIEQLVAESTGKDGKGILPVVGEPVGTPNVYGSDRVFVSLGKPQSVPPDAPLMTLDVQDPYDLGAEFFRWEFATAVVGAALELNPFDEPNVRENKEITKQLLQAFETKGKLPPAPSPSNDWALMKHLLQGLRGGQYLGILAYLPPTANVTTALQTLRLRIRDRFKVATTLGFGPRFLHSTGQYHKGGPKNGRFIQFTCDDKDLPIPGSKYGFSTLKQAQALGDFQVLGKKGRPIVNVHVSNLSELPAMCDQILALF